jgi:hypothetical protein
MAAEESVNLEVTLAKDLSNVKVALKRENGTEIAFANITHDPLRKIVGTLIDGLAQMEGWPHIASETLPKPGDEIPLPPVTPLPAWRIGRLDTGLPAIIFERYPGHWSAFSLTAEHGLEMAALLQEMLNHGA